MSTETKTEPTVDATNLVDDARAAAEHSEATSLAVIRPEQQRFDENQRAILRQLGIEDATDGDLDLFFHVCRTTGLDPFRRQVYMIGRNTKVTEWVDTANGGRRKEERYVTKYTIQTGIDGYRRNVREAAKRLGDQIRFDGPYFTGADDFHVTDAGEVIQHWRKVWPKGRPPHAARFVLYRNGEEFEGIAHYDEFVQTFSGGEPNAMWSKMPRNQLAKCAESLAYRRAYPDDLSGLVLEDATQPTTIIDGETGEVIQSGQRGRMASASGRTRPVSADEIFADEVPLDDRPVSTEDPGNPTDNPRSVAEQAAARAQGVAMAEADQRRAEREGDSVASETPDGAVAEDQGDGPADPQPAPSEQSETVPEPVGETRGVEGGPDGQLAQARAEEAAVKQAAADREAKATSKKIAAKRSTAPAANPDKPKSKMRQALEKRLFALTGDAGLNDDTDRDGRIAVYRAVLEDDTITSTDDLDDVAVSKLSDQLYAWQQQNVLGDEIGDILAIAVAAEETAKATADAPTSEGNQ